MAILKTMSVAMAASLVLSANAIANDADPSGARATGDPFDAYAFDCGDVSSNPGEIRERGPNQFIQNLYNLGPIRSTEPRIDGPTRVIVNVSLNTQENKGRFWGSLEMLPSAYEGQGSWVGLFDLDIPGRPTVLGNLHTYFTGIIVAHGTGVFEGRKLRFQHFIDLAIVPPSIPEGCVWTGEYWRGHIVPLEGSSRLGRGHRHLMR